MSIVYAKKNSEKNLKTVVFLSVFLLKEVKAELTHSFLTFDLLIRATLDTISNNKFISRERHSCSAILHCEQSLSTSTVHYTQKKQTQMSHSFDPTLLLRNSPFTCVK